MELISFTLNNLNFFINPFHTACMDRKPVMVDNTIGISPQSFGKGYYRSYFAFYGYRTPLVQKALSTFWISILPEFLQIILKDINSRDSLFFSLRRVLSCSFSSWRRFFLFFRIRYLLPLMTFLCSLVAFRYSVLRKTKRFSMSV